MTFSEDNESIRTPDADLGISRGGGADFQKKLKILSTFFSKKGQNLYYFEVSIFGE